MADAILIFCERTGAWAAALRRELALLGDPPPQRETRSLAECTEVLSIHPASLIVLEMTPANLPRAFDLLASLAGQFPQARSVVVAQRGLEAHAWSARELGALAFTTSPRTLGPIAALARRYFAALPPPQMTLKEQIWSRLPWKAAS